MTQTAIPETYAGIILRALATHPAGLTSEKLAALDPRRTEVIYEWQGDDDHAGSGWEPIGRRGPADRTDVAVTVSRLRRDGWVIAESSHWLALHGRWEHIAIPGYRLIGRTQLTLDGPHHARIPTEERLAGTPKDRVLRWLRNGGGDDTSRWYYDRDGDIYTDDRYEPLLAELAADGYQMQHYATLGSGGTIWSLIGTPDQPMLTVEQAYTPPVSDTERLDRAAVGAILGIDPRTVTTYRERYPDFPAPDGYIGRSPWWLAERAAEIRAWAESRPGRTGRPPKNSST